MSKYFFILLVFCSIYTVYAQDDLKPFASHNQGPLVHFFGLPANPGGKVLEVKHFEFQNTFNIANNASAAALLSESVYFDGEMYRNDLGLRYGLAKNLEIGLSIPLIKHSGGVMDPMISTWHETFGLPGRARNTMQDFKLSYWYMEQNTIVFQVHDSKLMLGDLAFDIGMQVIEKPRLKLALHAFAKFATGNKQFLIGSGTNDFGLQLGSSILPKEGGKLYWLFSGGYLHIGKGALLSDIVSKGVGFGSLATAIKINDHWVPKIQLDLHSAFYHKSDTKQLGETSAQLLLGVDYYIHKNLSLSAAFSEDIIVNTAPDFVLQFGVNYKL